MTKRGRAPSPAWHRRLRRQRSISRRLLHAARRTIQQVHLDSAAKNLQHHGSAPPRSEPSIFQQRRKKGELKVMTWTCPRCSARVDDSTCKACKYKWQRPTCNNCQSGMAHNQQQCGKCGQWHGIKQQPQQSSWHAPSRRTNQWKQQGGAHASQGTQPRQQSPGPKEV